MGVTGSGSYIERVEEVRAQNRAISLQASTGGYFREYLSFADSGNVDNLLAAAAKLSDQAAPVDHLVLAVWSGELQAFVRMLGAWIEAHAQRCEVRTGSAL